MEPLVPWLFSISHSSLPSLLLLATFSLPLRADKTFLPWPHKEQLSAPSEQWPQPTPRPWGEGGQRLLSLTLLRTLFSLPENLVPVVNIFFTLITSSFLYFLLEKEIKVKEIIPSSAQTQRKVRRASDLSSIRTNTWGVW